MKTHITAVLKRLEKGKGLVPAQYIALVDHIDRLKADYYNHKCTESPACASAATESFSTVMSIAGLDQTKHDVVKPKVKRRAKRKGAAKRKATAKKATARRS